MSLRAGGEGEGEGEEAKSSGLSAPPAKGGTADPLLHHPPPPRPFVVHHRRLTRPEPARKGARGKRFNLCFIRGKERGEEDKPSRRWNCGIHRSPSARLFYHFCYDSACQRYLELCLDSTCGKFIIGKRTKWGRGCVGYDRERISFLVQCKDKDRGRKIKREDRAMRSNTSVHQLFT